MTDDAAAPGWNALFQAGRAPAAAILVCGILLHSMNVLLTATVLPSIIADIGGASEISWPTTAYLAASIVAASGAGLLSATFGPKRAFIIGALIFGLGTLACGVAPDMGLFVGGRFIQGFGGGLLTATAYVIVRMVFPKTLWPRVFALFASVWSVSVLVGPLLGGAFATYGDWRGAFYALSVVALAVAVFAVVVFPVVAPPSGPAPRPPWGRVGLICLAIAAISGATLLDTNVGKLGCIGLGLALAWAMLRLDARSASPMLPSDAFSFRTATGLGLWTALLMLTAFAPLQVFAPLFLRLLHGLDPLAAGYSVAGASLAWTVAAIGVAGLSGRRQSRQLVLGPLAMALGLALTAFWMTSGPVLLLVATMAVVGGGIGGAWAFTAQRIMGNARPGEEDVAASSVATVQQGGTAFGAALAGVVANAASATEGVAGGAVGELGASAPAAVLGAGAIIALAAAGMGFRLSRRAP